MPNFRGPNILERAAELRARAERSIGFGVLSAPNEPKQLEALAEAGCERACHWIPSGPRTVVEAALAPWERAIAEFNGEV